MKIACLVCTQACVFDLILPWPKMYCKQYSSGKYWTVITKLKECLFSTAVSLKMKAGLSRVFLAWISLSYSHVLFWYIINVCRTKKGKYNLRKCFRKLYQLNDKEAIIHTHKIQNPNKKIIISQYLCKTVTFVWPLSLIQAACSSCWHNFTLLPYQTGTADFLPESMRAQHRFYLAVQGLMHIRLPSLLLSHTHTGHTHMPWRRPIINSQK